MVMCAMHYVLQVYMHQVMCCHVSWCVVICHVLVVLLSYPHQNKHVLHIHIYTTATTVHLTTNVLVRQCVSIHAVTCRESWKTNNMHVHRTNTCAGQGIGANMNIQDKQVTSTHWIRFWDCVCVDVLLLYRICGKTGASNVRMRSKSASAIYGACRSSAGTVVGGVVVAGVACLLALLSLSLSFCHWACAHSTHRTNTFHSGPYVKRSNEMIRVKTGTGRERKRESEEKMRWAWREM